MPSAKTGKSRTFACPFHGPYRFAELHDNNAKVTPVDQPDDKAIYVALDRLRPCPTELGDDFWPPRPRQKQNTVSRKPSGAPQQPEATMTSPWEDRLRPRPNQARTPGLNWGGRVTTRLEPVD